MNSEFIGEHFHETSSLNIFLNCSLVYNSALTVLFFHSFKSIVLLPSGLVISNEKSGTV